MVTNNTTMLAQTSYDESSEKYEVTFCEDGSVDLHWSELSAHGIDNDNWLSFALSPVAAERFVEEYLQRHPLANIA